MNYTLGTAVVASLDLPKIT